MGEAEGLRLFAEVSEKDATIYDWAARGPRVFDVCTASSDIVALCEYDVHNVRASYANGDQPFHAAMASQGYDGAFFTDPLIGRTPPAGLGVFWRSDVFELVEEQSDRVIACNTTTVSLSNHDLLEKRHPLVVPPTDGGGVAATDLPAADRPGRRGAAAPQGGGRIVCVADMHLMTTSRGGPGVTRPGEVRAESSPQ